MNSFAEKIINTIELPQIDEKSDLSYYNVAVRSGYKFLLWTIYNKINVYSVKSYSVTDAKSFAQTIHSTRCSINDVIDVVEAAPICEYESQLNF
jgi:hypothetical protein